MPDNADDRFTPDTLAAVSRVHARDAAMRVATDGVRWVLGAAEQGAIDASGLDAAVGTKSILQAQGGAVADMDSIADALYGRSSG